MAFGFVYGFYRHWSGFQRALFLLHTLALLMKLHSYYAYCLNSRPPRPWRNLKSYAVYLFMPTFIYAKSYPRTSKYCRD